MSSLALIDQDWTSEAACTGADTDMFFPEGVTEAKYMLIRARKLYCDQCPVRPQCYGYAIRTGAVGIWGGTLIPLRSRPPQTDPDRPIPAERDAQQLPRRLRESDEEPGWWLTLIRKYGRKR